MNWPQQNNMGLTFEILRKILDEFQFQIFGSKERTVSVDRQKNKHFTHNKSRTKINNDLALLCEHICRRFRQNKFAFAQNDRWQESAKRDGTHMDSHRVRY